jgi:predicted phage-related endonuclease
VKSRSTVPLEIKTTSEKNRFHWVKSGPPIYYLTQLHVQMAAVGADHGYVAALFGGQQALYWRLDWNPVLWERIDRLGREFHQYVLDGECPPADFATEPYDPKSVVESKRGEEEGTEASLAVAAPEGRQAT